MPPRTNGAIRSMTLMPVSKISIVGESSPKAGGSRWIGQRSPVAASLPSTGSPMTFQMRPSVWSPTGTEIGCSRVDDLDAAREPVGRVHRDGAHAIVAEMLLHLRDQLARAAVLGDLDAERVVDLGEPVREDGVEHDALDLDDLPRVLAVALVGH